MENILTKVLPQEGGLEGSRSGLYNGVIGLLGLFTLFSPSSIASAPLLVIGWAMLVYGVVEAVNALKVSNNRRRWHKTQEIQKR